MTNDFSRRSGKYGVNTFNFHEHVDEDLDSHPILLAKIIVENFARNYEKVSSTNVSPSKEIAEIEDISILLKNFEKINASYTKDSQKYLHFSCEVLRKLKELSENLNEGFSFRIDYDVEDIGIISQLYDNLNIYIIEAKEVEKRIRVLLSDPDNMENYKDQFNEMLKLWDVSKDNFKGIGEKRENSEYYIVNEMLKEISNVESKLADSKEEIKKNIDEFLNLIKARLIISKEDTKKIITKFLNSMNSFVKSFMKEFYPSHYKDTFDLSSNASEVKLDGKASYVSLDDDGKPKGSLIYTDTESTFRTSDKMH